MRVDAGMSQVERYCSATALPSLFTRRSNYISPSRARRAWAWSSARQGAPIALAFIDMRMPPGWDGLETISICGPSTRMCRW